MKLASSESRAEFRSMIGWVDDGDNHGHYDPWNVTVLHKNNENQQDHNAIFKNIALMKVSSSSKSNLMYRALIQQIKHLDL